VEAMNMQFNNAVEDLSHDESRIRDELHLFWERFGSGTFRTTRRCASCQDELVQNPEFTELIVPVNGNDNNVTLERLILDDSSSRDDDNVWRCDNCNVLTRPIKTRRIESHPVVLCILVHRISYDAQNNTETRVNAQVAFPIVDFNPNANLDGDDEHQTYDLISGIFHQTTGRETAHYTAVCSTDDDWITYDDRKFRKNDFLNKRAKTPTAKVGFHRGAYMLFYKRRENDSLSRDTESNHVGPEDDDDSETDERFSDVENMDDGVNVNNPNGFNESGPSVVENTYGLDNRNPASSVTMNNINNPTESGYSGQSAEERTNGHISDSPSTSVVTPQTCPTQRNHEKQIPFINLSSDTEDDDEDDVEEPRCQMCWHTIKSDEDVGHIETQRRCECNKFQYHSFCLRRYRNQCENKNITMQCGKHGNEIRRMVNIDRYDTCMICQEDLDDTKSIWGRFVCGTCHHWYHYDCLETYTTKEDSYHKDNRTNRYDMTKLKCIICKGSPRTIERL